MNNRLRRRLRRNAIRLKQQESHLHRWEPRPAWLSGPAFRCGCGATTFACGECREPMNRRENLDEAFLPELFGGEGVYVAYECRNGHRYFEPFD